MLKAGLRWIVDTTSHMVGILRRRRRLTPSANGAVKVNLGCGLTVAPGWINVDGSLNALAAAWPVFLLKLLYRFSGARSYYSQEAYCSLLRNHVFVHHDLSHSIPFVDKSVDTIYTSHFLEHLSREDGENLLRECLRVLKPGGILRVCVPDLAYAVGLYRGGTAEKMLDCFFIEDQGGSFSRHKYMYDFRLLKSSLERAGFDSIQQLSFQVGEVADCIHLDNRPEETLFVEARKICNPSAEITSQ